MVLVHFLAVAHEILPGSEDGASLLHLQDIHLHIHD
jgi:hypothetical protein